MNKASRSIKFFWISGIAIVLLISGCSPVTGTHEHVLDSLKDVLVSDPADGDVIVFEDNAGKDFWVPEPLVLDTLRDVSAPGPSDKAVLQWSEADNHWVPGLHEHVMGSLRNVLASEAVEGDILILDQNGKDIWKPEPHTMDTLRDVSAAAPEHGDVLIWNETTGQWEAGTMPACSDPQADFVGAWHSDDVDGSEMWLWITDYHGAYEILWYDNGCSACNEWGNGPSCLVVASGHISGPDTLEIDGGKMYCYWDEGTELLEGVDVTAVQTYDSGADQITHDNAAGYLVTWTRTDDGDPAQVIDPVPFAKP